MAAQAAIHGSNDKRTLPDPTDPEITQAHVFGLVERSEDRLWLATWMAASAAMTEVGR
jgi:hypothetical protein